MAVREAERAKGVMGVMRASRPSFRNNHDRIAFAVHSAFLADGYSLISTGIPAFTSDAAGHEEEVGIDGWNSVDDEYAFIYLTPDGKDKVLVKCLVIGDKLAVCALKYGPNQPLHLQVDVNDFTGDVAASNYAAQFKNLEKLVKVLDAEILSKLSGASHSGSARNDATRGGFVGGGSNLLGPNAPSWFGGGGDGGLRHPGYPGGQPGVPPGARFDPFGPTDVPGFLPWPFARKPRRPGGDILIWHTFPPYVPGFEPWLFARNPRRLGGDTHPDLEYFCQ